MTHARSAGAVWAALQRRKAPPRSKYGAKSVEVDGIKFASGREARRWSALLIDERAGRITYLKRQVVFILAPAVRITGEMRARRAMRYTADFTYTRDGQKIVEDAKGYADTSFRMRQNLMCSVHGIHVRVT